MNAHTTGPWAIRLQPNGHRTVRCALGAEIARMGGENMLADDSSARANANLVAAAPDLLAALQEMLKYAEGFEDADHVIDAYAAVARATGKTQ